MYEHICCNCMEDTKGKDPCPYCGASLSLENLSPALRTRTLLHDEKYLIGRCLGQGGFGITYIGKDLQLDRTVAIKEFLPKQIADRAADGKRIMTQYKDEYEYGLNKFLQEARTLARFTRHPNIVRIVQFFSENNTAYFEMDYIRGKTLEEYVKEISPGEVEAELLKVMAAVLQGLKKVHDVPILHRDIKPSNIYIPDEGEPFLLDFGSARQSMMNKNQSLSILLTHGYAPFEQYTSTLPQGPYTDIYACAATMYTCLRRRYEKGRLLPPPRATDLKAGTKQIEPLNDPSLSPYVLKAIMKGLNQEPKRRPQTVAEFQELLHLMGKGGSWWQRMVDWLRRLFHLSKQKTATFQDALSPPQKQAPKSLELRVIAGEYEGERLPLSSTPIIIGRNPQKSALILSGKDISGTHCEIKMTSDVVYVRDLNSTNGTYINDAIRLAKGQTAELKLHDTISLAGCAVFEIVEAGK